MKLLSVFVYPAYFSRARSRLGRVLQSFLNEEALEIAEAGLFQAGSRSYHSTSSVIALRALPNSSAERRETKNANLMNHEKVIHTHT